MRIPKNVLGIWGCKPPSPPQDSEIEVNRREYFNIPLDGRVQQKQVQYSVDK
jgi:hypothetical protein